VAEDILDVMEFLKLLLVDCHRHQSRALEIDVIDEEENGRQSIE
jgi:hypothetical protein